jgi:hypothetical protein
MYCADTLLEVYILTYAYDPDVAIDSCNVDYVAYLFPGDMPDPEEDDSIEEVLTDTFDKSKLASVSKLTSVSDVAATNGLVRRYPDTRIYVVCLHDEDKKLLLENIGAVIGNLAVNNIQCRRLTQTRMFGKRILLCHVDYKQVICQASDLSSK